MLEFEEWMLFRAKAVLECEESLLMFANNFAAIAASNTSSMIEAETPKKPKWWKKPVPKTEEEISEKFLKIYMIGFENDHNRQHETYFNLRNGMRALLRIRFKDALDRKYEKMYRLRAHLELELWDLIINFIGVLSTSMSGFNELNKHASDFVKTFGGALDNYRGAIQSLHVRHAAFKDDVLENQFCLRDSTKIKSFDEFADFVGILVTAKNWKAINPGANLLKKALEEDLELLTRAIGVINGLRFEKEGKEMAA
jgi:hypothetical protein